MNFMFVLRDVILTYLLTYLCQFLVRSMGHRPRNAIDVYLWSSFPSLSWCIPSPVLLVFLCVSARCPVAFLTISSLRFPYDVLTGDGFWRFLKRVPYPPPFSLLYFIFTCSCLVHSQNVLLGTLSVLTGRILLRHL